MHRQGFRNLRTTGYQNNVMSGQFFADFNGSEKMSDSQNVLTVNDYFHEMPVCCPFVIYIRDLGILCVKRTMNYRFTSGGD
jgi:hypothetical protein